LPIDCTRINNSTSGQALQRGGDVRDVLARRSIRMAWTSY